MADEICPACGERNALGAQFCVGCQAFLGWDATIEQRAIEQPVPRLPLTHAAGQAQPSGGAQPVLASPRSPAPDGRLRVVVQQREVQVAPGGEPAALVVSIANQSTIVDAYVVEAPGAPSWLQVTPAEVRLLPHTDETVRLLVHIPGGSTVVAHETGLPITVRSGTDPSVRYDDIVRLIVLAIDVPITLRLEPSLVRVRGSHTGRMQLVADNRRSNRSRRVHLAGRDPEGVVRFTFAPPTLDIPAGHVTSANLRVDAPHPEPGKEATRQLTVSASDGQRAVETSATFVQSSPPPVVDLPMGLQLGPSLIRVRDRGSGESRLIADNRGGSRPLRVALAGHDPERIVRFTFSPAVLDVPAWGTAAAQVRVAAPRPAGGQEAARQITVTASDGHRVAEAAGTLVQTSSDRRPIARVLCTLLGGLAMILGAFAPWTANPRIGGVDWTYLIYGEVIGVRVPQLSDEVQRFIPSILISAGLVIILLGALAILGLTGSKGRLTRMMALLGAAFLAIFLIVLWLGAGAGQPAFGAVTVFIGCVSAFIGGVLARR